MWMLGDFALVESVESGQRILDPCLGSESRIRVPVALSVSRREGKKHYFPFFDLNTSGSYYGFFYPNRGGGGGQRAGQNAPGTARAVVSSPY